MTAHATPGSGLPSGGQRGIRLSPQGRRRFGEFVANGLLAAAAGVASITVAPALSSDASSSPNLVATGIVLSALLVAGAAVVRYTTEERDHEER
jgi:hypothetical protein